MPRELIYRLRISRPARLDLEAIEQWSLERFGQSAALRYQALVFQAFRDLRIDPHRPGSRERPEMMVGGARSYHLSFSRACVTGPRVKQPRHLILYREVEGVIVIGRILHDGQELIRHLPDDYRTKGEERTSD